MTKIYQEPWKEFAKFLNYTPLVIPSKEDIGHIEYYLKKLLKKNKTPNILIMGCTVNYRKLFSKYMLKIDLVDATPQMYMYDPKTLNKLKRKETFIRSNWLDMRLKKKYDIILGDFVIHNVPFHKRPLFYKNIKRHLKNHGIFVTRTYFQPKKYPTEKEIVEEYKSKPLTMKNLTEISFDFIFFLSFNKKMHRASNRKAFLIMKKSATKNDYLKKWVEIFEKKFPTNHKYWGVLPYIPQKKQLSKYFKIIDELYSKDYKHHNLCPTYVLRK